MGDSTVSHGIEIFWGRITLLARTDAAIYADWKRKLVVRENLLAAAVHRGDAALVKTRKAQVADAKAVIARHKPKPLRLRALAEAQKDVGIREVGNNRGAAVEKIIREAGGTPGESWCGDAVFCWYHDAGSKAPVRAWAAVRLLEQLLTKVHNPAPGHVVIYQWDSGDPDHTGLFDGWINKKTGDFWAIEGNTGATGATSDTNGADGVRRRERNTRQVSSFRRVLR